MIPELHTYHRVMVNSSGGKDSQTALRYVIDLARMQDYPRDRIVVAHADLGRMEWDGTKDLAQQQAEHYGLRFLITERRDAGGKTESLLDYVRRRGKWPSSTTRFCTSDFKRGPCGRLLTQLDREARTDRKQHIYILNVFGFRAEESTARAKRKVFDTNLRSSTTTRTVDDWLPIHSWTEEQVWASIRSSGVAYHPAYDLGMPRLSCSFCIFAPRPALLIAGKARPELLQEYVDLEREIGHDFQHNKPIREIQEALARGEEPGQIDGNWNM